MKSILKSVAVLCCMATLAVLAACTKGSNSTGEKPVYKYLHYADARDNMSAGEREQYAAYCWRLERKDKAQMIALFYDYIQDNHAKGYQTKWGQWKRQFSDK